MRDFEEEKAAAIFKNVEKLAKSYKVKRFFDKDKETLKEVFSRLKKSEFSVTNVDEKIKRIPPARYFDLTELQRHANKLYGFQAGQTLKIAQSLYEKHKLISYPRTDSRYISKDILNGLEDVFNSAKVYLGESADCVEYRQLSKRFVDDTKVSDHHAIIPTGIYWTLKCKRRKYIVSSSTDFTVSWTTIRFPSVRLFVRRKVKNTSIYTRQKERRR